MSLCYGNIGMVLQDRGNLDGAMKMYQKSLAICEELGIGPDVAALQQYRHGTA